MSGTDPNDPGITLVGYTPEPEVDPRALPTTLKPDPTTAPTHASAADGELVRLGGPDRYLDEGPLGAGSLGVVRRMRDLDLGRAVAMKILKVEHSSAATARFLEEAQLTAQLEHPGIVPVHEVGRLPDGRLYFTMREVVGKPLSSWISAVHRREGPANLRRLVSMLLLVAEAVGVAHSRGVVHRDLKPSNIMIGDHGEVYVVDWGLARLVPRGVLRTGTRSVSGTPAYMSPEQARGEPRALDPRSDVYGLGAVLYEILSGRAPYSGKTEVALAAVRAGPPPRLPATGPDGDPVPDGLIALCERAMSRDSALRPANAAEFADELRDWQTGVIQAARARDLVAQAAGTWPLVEDARRRSTAMAAYATVERERVAPTAPIAAKSAWWAAEDEAAELLREAERLELRAEQLLRGALAVHPGDTHALAALADIYQRRHREAEARGDDVDARRQEALLREHDIASRHATWLEGRGSLSLDSDPSGAHVELQRYDTVERRLVAVPVRSLGVTPLSNLDLPRGSYRLRLTRRGREEVLLPVKIDRCGAWRNTPPGAEASTPVVLPPAGALSADEAYIPAGYARVGGDPQVPCGPRDDVWVDGFVMSRDPVTNAQFITFLDDLVANGREAEALLHAPRERAGTAGDLGPVIYGRDEAGRFTLRADADGEAWKPDVPVVMIDFAAARAYAAWLAARSGLPWRLPTELEWEKSARGVDERPYPFGAHPDPTWLCVRPSHTTSPQPAPIDAFPDDVSPYGVRGLGGNVRDWCLDAALAIGPTVVNGRAPIPTDAEVDAAPDAPRSYRGGDWFGLPVHARSAYRAWNKPQTRSYSLGFRLVRSV